MLIPLLLAWTPNLVPQATPDLPDLYALKASVLETGTGEVIEHAVLLVEGGKIIIVGEDLVVERGIPVYELEPHQVVMPGLVNAYTRVGVTGSGPNGVQPWMHASDELYPAAGEYAKAREAGVTTLGHYPSGNGIPGRSVVVRPKGASASAMTLKDDAYLKVIMSSSKSAKSSLSGGFKNADAWLEKEAKNKEKWDTAKEKFDKEDDEEKKKKLDPGPYEPLKDDPKAVSFMQLRDGSLKALISVRTAGDYLHLIDAIGEEKFSWDLRVVMTRDLNIYHVLDKLAASGRRVVLEPEISLHPGTMRQRNLPAEFARAGIPLVLVPRNDSVSGYEAWRRHVGEIVASGLERSVAMRAITLEPAALLGVDDRVGSLEAGKDANIVILSGDPLEPGTQVDAVILEGELVSGEVNL